MTTIVTRTSKGSALTHAEMDANFTNLNNDKVETSILANYSTTVKTDASIAAALAVHIDDTIDAHVSSAISYLPAGTGATVTNVQTKLRESVSVNDFGGLSNGVVDDTAAINAAMAIGKTVLFPMGGNAFLNNITLPSNSSLMLEAGHSWFPAATKHITANGFNIDSIAHPTGPVFVGTGTKSSLNTQQFISGATPTVGVNISSFDSVSAGSAFQIAAAILATKSGGSGHREALHVEQSSSGSAVGEFVVGANFIGKLTGGSGNAFGLNSYAWIDTAALATAEACSYEANTDVRRTVARKVGIQVIDVATSTSSGTGYDAALLVGSQPGGVGYSAGLQFGLDGTTGFGILDGGKLIVAPSSTKALHSGIDFGGLSGAFSAAPIVLPANNGGIRWGATGAGGLIESQTASNGGRMLFAVDTVAMQSSAATNMAIFTSTESYLMVTTGSGPLLRRVEADAVNTAGAGYRNLRIGN